MTSLPPHGRLLTIMVWHRGRGRTVQTPQGGDLWTHGGVGSRELEEFHSVSGQDETWQTQHPLGFDGDVQHAWRPTHLCHIPFQLRLIGQTLSAHRGLLGYFDFGELSPLSDYAASEWLWVGIETASMIVSLTFALLHKNLLFLWSVSLTSKNIIKPSKI